MATTANKMQYRLLGKSGLKVSVISFGSWVTFKAQVDTMSAYDLMRESFKAGVNFFDNAEGYEAGHSEIIMGEAIQEGIKNGDWSREDLVISTKIFFGYKQGVNNKGLSRKHIIEGMKNSLKRMNLEYVDLVFCHRPDPITPMEEVVRAMNFVLDQGWAFYWGTSEWSATQITEACLIADRLGLIRPLMDQPEYNMFKRDRIEIEYLPLYENYGLGTTIWSPLASGILTGKYSGGNVPEGSRFSLPSYQWLKDRKFSKMHEIELADKLKPVAESIGCTLAQLAIAWCIKNPHVSTVITGATSLKQLNENIAALEFVEKLTPEVIEKIESILQNKPEYDSITKQVKGIRG